MWGYISIIYIFCGHFISNTSLRIQNIIPCWLYWFIILGIEFTPLPLDRAILTFKKGVCLRETFNTRVAPLTSNIPMPPKRFPKTQVMIKINGGTAQLLHPCSLKPQGPPPWKNYVVNVFCCCHHFFPTFDCTLIILVETTFFAGTWKKASSCSPKPSSCG